MHELLKNYVAKKEAEKRELYEKKKNDLLISQGLYEKVYSDKSRYSKEFSNQEFDSDTNKYRYYKMVPIEISEEEYQQIKELSNTTNPVEKNIVASILTGSAWIIFIVGFILGIVFGNVEIEIPFADYSEFSFAIALIYWATSFISGLILLGIAEIIKLINNVSNTLRS